MGGSGGTPGYGGGRSGGGFGGGTGGGVAFCESVNENVVLQSAEDAVVAPLKRDDKLLLQLTDGGVPIVAVTPTGAVAGSIILRSNQLAFVRCMQNGHEYEARVTSNENGICRVTVTHT